METQAVELATGLAGEHITVNINTAHDAGNAQEGDHHSVPSRQNTFQAHQSRVPPVDAQKQRKEVEPGSQFLGIPAYQSPYSGNRSYNYEEKYAPDPVGKETRDNARVWKVYLDEAEDYDNEMLRGFKDTIDSLLVFAALFSAVVTSFVISTVPALQPNYSQATATLLLEQVQILRAAGNITAINAIPSSNMTQSTLNSVAPGTNDLRVNGLFFGSLSLSLTTALLSVLIKQWLQAYSSISSGNAREQALIRQFRFAGLENWKVPEIIGILPLILHTSLALFFVGLSLYVAEIHESLMWVVVIITILAFTMYLGSMFLPAIWLQCPYRISLLFVPVKYILHVFSILGRTFKPLLQIMSVTVVQYFIGAFSRTCKQLAFQLSQMARQIHFATFIEHSITNLKKMIKPKFPIYSLKQSELDILIQDDVQHTFQADILAWLCTLKSNLSIQRIVVQSMYDLLANNNPVARMLAAKEEPWVLRKIYQPRLWNQFSPLSETMWNSFIDLSHEDIHGLQIWPKVILQWIKAADEIFGQEIKIETVQKSFVRAVARSRGVAVEIFLEMSKLENSPLKDTMHDWSSAALHDASSRGHLSIVKILIESGGAEVNMRNDKSETPLQVAGQRGHLEIVTYLVDKGAELNAQGGIFWAALQAVSCWGKLDIVQFLVEKGADVNIQGGEYGTALQAGATKSLEIVRYLVDKGADIHAQGGYFGTALQAASYNGKLNIIQFLVEKGADVNIQRGKFGTALQAGATKSLEIVKYLVDKSADIHAQGGRFWTALQAASYWEKLDVVQFLVEKGADVNRQGGRYGNALQAGAIKNLEIVRYLVYKGADVNAQGGLFGTALQAASCTGKLGIVQFLVEKGANVNAEGGGYGTALQAASYLEKFDIVQFLVEKGADVNAQGGEYGSPLKAALARRGNDEIIQFLRDHGARE